MLCFPSKLCVVALAKKTLPSLILNTFLNNYSNSISNFPNPSISKNHEIGNLFPVYCIRITHRKTQCIMVSHDSEHHRKTCTKFFFCLLFCTLIHLVLLLTIFQAILHVRHPKATISRVTVQDLHFNFSSHPSEEMYLVTQVTLHNPTLGSFRLQNGNLVFLYNQTEIGLGLITGVRVKGRSMKKLSIVTLLNSTSLLMQHDIRSFSDDIDSGVLQLTARIKLNGEIQLMKVIKRTKTLETHCVMVVNLVLLDTQSIKCK